MNPDKLRIVRTFHSSRNFHINRYCSGKRVLLENVGELLVVIKLLGLRHMQFTIIWPTSEQVEAIQTYLDTLNKEPVKMQDTP